MTTLPCLAGGPVQFGIGVDDMHAAVTEWEAKGAGPFVVREHIEVEPSWFDHSSAYGWWGEIMVELVHVHAPAELSWCGAHHVAFFVESFADAQAQLTAAGFPSVLTARAGTTDFAFHDARSERLPRCPPRTRPPDRDLRGLRLAAGVLLDDPIDCVWPLISERERPFPARHRGLRSS